MDEGFLNLFNQVADELEKIKLQNEQNQNEQNDFNIFQILGVETDEVKACRFIGALLDPKEKHGLGNMPLQLFLKDVLKVEHKVSSDAYIVLENRITDDRRVDIVIYNGKYVYPIEAKIKAEDQESQLFDYYQFFFEDNTDRIIYYLTPNGRCPTQRSIQQKNNNLVALSESQYKCLSFNKDIKEWLENVSIQEKTVKTAMCGIIKQYIGVIIDMCAKANEYNAILEAAGLTENRFPESKDGLEKLNALISILSANGDTNGDLQRAIQAAYLKQNLSFDKNKFEFYKEAINYKDNKYAIVGICKKNSGDPIAWICIETNLYIISNKGIPNWNKKSNWAYLAPEGHSRKNNKYPLNDCKNIISHANNRIDIDNYLDSIVKARDRE